MISQSGLAARMALPQRSAALFQSVAALLVPQLAVRLGSLNRSAPITVLLPA